MKRGSRSVVFYISHRYRGGVGRQNFTLPDGSQVYLRAEIIAAPCEEALNCAAAYEDEAVMNAHELPEKSKQRSK